MPAHDGVNGGANESVRLAKKVVLIDRSEMIDCLVTAEQLAIPI
jgi:hypothetical protein